MTTKGTVITFFQGKSKQAVAEKITEYELPKSEDPLILAFYAQLTDREKIAHAIAVTKLGTSYDVTRTHGFLKWCKSQKGGGKGEP